MFKYGWILLLSINFINASAEPANLSLLKTEIQAYHDTGRYQQAVDLVITQAKKHIDRQIKRNSLRKNQQKLALVLDIDETSLSNYDNMVKRDFNADLRRMHQEVCEASAPAIKSTLALYQYARQHGIAVFFVTGRREFEKKATELNLHRAGFADWQGLYLRPVSNQHYSITSFKTSSRALITHQGYTIIANIGDQYSDLLGGFAQKEFKLPNPFYFLP